MRCQQHYALPSENTINISNDILTNTIKDVTIDTTVLSFRSFDPDTSIRGK